MYIFNRTRQARSAAFMDAMASSVEIAEKVTQITGIDIHVWAARFGAPIGTISWSCRIESQAEFFEATEKLTVDATYLDMAMSMSEQYEGPAEDMLMRVVSSTPTPSPSKFYVVTTATMANGKYREAMEWGVAMQEYACDGVGVPGMFGSAPYGNFAGVGWLMGHDTMASVDAGADWEAGDAGYHERLDGAKKLFIPGSGQQRLIERLN